MELENRAFQQSTKGNVLQNPPIIQPVRHDAVQEKGGGDWRALKVFALSSGILGQHRDGNVETGQSRQAAQDEERESGSVENRSQSEGECDHGGGDTERNLHGAQSIIVSN